MQAGTVDRLIALLQGNSWNIKLGRPLGRMTDVLAQHPEYREFAERVQVAESPEGDAWLIASEDYCDESGEGWNFIEEQLSVPAAGEDEQWLAEIREFWKNHLPIAISAKGDYTYLALDNSGKVVLGTAPEPEIVTVVARSLDEFVEIFEQQSSEKCGDIYDSWMGR